MKAIIQTYGQDGYINIDADSAIETEDFVYFYRNKNDNDSNIVAMVAKTELKSFYFSEKKKSTYGVKE